MTAPTVEHSTFVIERTFPHGPRHAFRFWAEADLKALWTGCHADWQVLEDRFDFRVGGEEAKRWRTGEGDELTFFARYVEIVPPERIIYAYDMSFGGKLISASLVTVELAAAAGGTLMRFTEQAAFLGEGQRDGRVRGTGEGFDRLGEAMDGVTAVIPGR